MKAVIFHDHVPEDAAPDQLDNLVQAKEIGKVLSQLGYRVSRLAVSGDLDETSKRLHRIHPDLVINLVESIWEQARWIHLAPAILERLEIPFTGSGSEAILNTTNKLKAKRILRKVGLPTPDWITFGENRIKPDNGLRWIVKSVWEHASIGLDEDSVFTGADPARLIEEMENRRVRLGGDCFAEKYIEGREFNVALLAATDGPEVLPPAEIVFDGYGEGKLRVVGYRAKWLPDSYEYHHTPRTFDFGPDDRKLLEEIKLLCLECWRLFGLRGWARVDFRVDRQGRPWILEVNANPCISSDAGFMAAADRAGLNSLSVVRRIVADAGDYPEKIRPERLEVHPSIIRSEEELENMKQVQSG